MTEQGIVNAQLNGKIEVLAQEMKDFKDEMKDFKNEMRDRDTQRHAEMSEIRQSLQAIQANVNNVSTAAFIGVGAVVISSISVLVAAVYSILK